MTARIVVTLSVAVLALAGVGVAEAAPAKSHGTTVTVVAKDYSFTLSTKRVKRGLVTFLIRNDGHTAHDFSIAGHRSKTIDPGGTTRLEVTLEPGRHPYKCTVDSHAELGMKGVLVVES
jgi:plastocyanin